MTAKSDQMKGKAKQVAGVVSGDKDLEAEGKNDRRAAEAQAQVERAKSWIEDVIDKVERARLTRPGACSTGSSLSQRRVIEPTTPRLLVNARESVPSVGASCLAAPVPTHDTETEPHQRPEHRSDNRVQPQRPGEAPDKEPELHVLGVLHDEDEQDGKARERSNRPCAEPATTRIRITLLTHQVLLDHV